MSEEQATTTADFQAPKDHTKDRQTAVACAARPRRGTMRRLIAGLDYGTSNSGAGYAIVHDDDERTHSSDDLEVVRDWPCAGGSRDASEKVPSEIAYDVEGRPVGHGFEASQHPAPLQWVKLLLEPESFKEQSNRTSRVWESYYALDSHALKKRPVDAVADYLRWLWGRVKAAIVEREAEDEDSELFEPSHLTVVLTVPASWSAPAKQRMATAAVIAGIPEQCLKTLAEPEAAAVHGLRKKARQRHVGDGDCVIICDAGGGTVDVVAYQVRTREPLSLAQITVSKGDFCGSSFVNKEFRNQLRSILGDKYKTLTDEANKRIDEEFEYKIKRMYSPFEEGNHSYYIPVDGLENDESLEIRNGRMRIEEAVIFAAFDSVMTQIWALIDDQVAQIRSLGLEHNMKGLLLVGGFGRSAYLRSRIKQEFSGRHDPKVWAADDSWTAVVRGAVACEASAIGRQALIHSRLSGYNYGVPFVDRGKRKVHWLVRKGQSVQSNMSTEPYALRIDEQPWLDQDENCLVFVPIVTSSEEDPGDEYRDTVTSHAEIRCRVPTALRFKPGSKEIQVSPSRAWHIPATLVLYFDGALISFRCNIEGHEVGVAEVKYFQDEADCTTEEDLISESNTSLRENATKHIRADSKISKISIVSDSSSERAVAQPPVALGLDKETAGTPTSPKTALEEKERKKREKEKKQKEKERKRDNQHYLFGLRTKRDSPHEHHHHHRFLAPSAASVLPVDERLNKVYRKGWEPRED